MSLDALSGGLFRTAAIIVKPFLDKYNSEFVGVPVVRVEMFRVTYI